VLEHSPDSSGAEQICPEHMQPSDPHSRPTYPEDTFKGRVCVCEGERVGGWVAEGGGVHASVCVYTRVKTVCGVMCVFTAESVSVWHGLDAG